MNDLDWLQNYNILQGDSKSIFSFGGAAPDPPPGVGSQGSQPPPQTPLAVQILWANLSPHYKLGSNAVIPLNKEDNEAPHPTHLSHKSLLTVRLAWFSSTALMEVRKQRFNVNWYRLGLSFQFIHWLSPVSINPVSIGNCRTTQNWIRNPNLKFYKWWPITLSRP